MARRSFVPQRQTEAFVLRTHDFGEGHRVVVLLSAEEGRIDGVARGARRFKSRYGAALEPLSWVRLHYRERPGQDLVSIAQVELLRSSFELLARPETLTAFSHLVDLAQAVSVQGEGRPAVVRLLHACLDAIRTLPAPEPGPLAHLRVYFDLWIARLEGFWPALGACSGCGAGLDGPRRVGIDEQGALCRDCHSGGGSRTLSLSTGAVELAERMIREPPAAIIAAEAPPAAVEELTRVAAALITLHLDRQLRTIHLPPAIRRSIQR